MPMRFSPGSGWRVLAATLLVALLARAGAAGESASAPRPSTTRLFAVSPTFTEETGRDAKAFRAALDDLFAEIAPLLSKDHPNVVLLPEDLGVPLCLSGWQGMAARRAKSLEEAMALVAVGRWPQVAWAAAKFPNTSMARRICLALTDRLWKPFHDACRALARLHGVYLVACVNVADARESTDPLDLAVFREGSEVFTRRSVFVPVDGNVYNQAFLYDPSGTIIGNVKKAHLIDLEGPKGVDLTPGRLGDARVFDTPAGRIGIAICFDGFHDDYMTRLNDLGAEIVLQPSANPQPWAAPTADHPWQPEDWIRSVGGYVSREGQYANVRYHACSMLRGRICGVTFDGQSAIAARGHAGSLSFIGTEAVPSFLAVGDWLADDDRSLPPADRRARLVAAQREISARGVKPKSERYRRGRVAWADVRVATATPVDPPSDR
ncbi:MAG: carbon-nitrogen hydrolase family protein [Planctomycetes bacterium]|nr:carbon-nitrogen hydrolase family protein [Planctomycetota bacterium]